MQNDAEVGPRTPIVRVIDCHIARPSAQGGYEYLLLKRSNHKIYAGSWRMVGGKLHDEETAWQGCLRELREETRLHARRLFAVPFVNRFYEWQSDRINDIPVFVAVTPEAGDPILDDEHREFAWHSLEEAVRLVPWPGQRDGMQAAHHLLTGGEELQRYLEVQLPS